MMYSIERENFKCLLSKLNIESNELIYYNVEKKIGSFDVLISKNKIGRIYIFNKQVQDDFESENTIFIAELNTK